MAIQDNQPQVDSQTSGHILPWIVWGLGGVFYFYEFLLQVSPSVMSTELMADFHITSQTLGLLSGVYFVSYALLQLPAGVLLDRYGARRLLIIATFICAISTLAFGLTEDFFTACIARFAIGFGSAFAALGCMKLAATWFPPNRFALLTGMMVTIGMLGAIGGETPLALLIDHIGWRISMILLGAIGLLLCFLMFLIIQDKPKDALSTPVVCQEEELSIFKSLATYILRNKQLWLIAIYGGLMYMSTPVFCGLWGVPFLMTKLHLSKTVAANYVSLIFIGWAIAGPLWGIFSNQMHLRKPPLYLASIGALTTSLLFIFCPINSLFTMQILLFLFGAFSSGFLPAFAVAKELCNPIYVATGLSFMNMMNMIGATLAQPLIGIILDRLWQGQLVNTVRIYPVSAYHIALSLLPLAILIALLILPFVKETHCRSSYDTL